MTTVGSRINTFDNLEEQTVKTFNILFPEVKLTDCNETDIVSIGEITANAVTRLIKINNIAKEHCFIRRTTSENDYVDLCDNSIDDNDADWLFYFV